MHVMMEPTLPGPRGLTGWFLVRVVSPVALWFGRRRWGASRGVWFIEPNQPLPFLFRWLGGKGAEVHRLWMFADDNGRELRLLFAGRGVTLMWKSAESG